MFQFPPFAPSMMVACLQHAGLPHSEISGSRPVCSSPELVAAYHVLHRLQKPRHPPSALVTFSLFVFSNHFWITRTFVFTLVLIYSLPWNCSPQHQTIDSLSYYSLQTNLISSSNFTSLSFLKLVNELCFCYRYFSNGLQRYDFFLYLQIFLKLF